ncbi:MAG: rimO [Acidobacteria bacterium]|nr:rimO [Acidobacteriota bacterium]
MAKIGFISLGCPKNLVDSEVMLGILRREGHTPTANASEADVIIVNTCSFINDSKKESIDAILEAARFKKNGTCRRLIVAGCLAERYPQEIRAELKEVDALVGVNQIRQIGRAVQGRSVLSSVSSRGFKDGFYLYDHTTPRMLTGPNYSAYIKIAEGCDHTCAFCAIPGIRGPFRSRSLESVIREARRLATKGVKEITLVSQDTTSYGLDLGMQDGLACLLAALDNVDGIRWIRFLYTCPNLLSDQLLQVIASSEKICKYIDLPLQHASARILKSMKRGGSGSSLTKTIGRIRKAIPGVTLRTTMLVGFPGETEEDFLELLDFCEEIKFDRLGVFAYSKEEGTEASKLGSKVPSRLAHRRRAILMKQQSQISRAANRRLCGREFPVLIEGCSSQSELLLQGRLESQAPEIDGVCLINDSDVGQLEEGEFRTIRIIRAMEHDLIGKIVR